MQKHWSAEKKNVARASGSENKGWSSKEEKAGEVDKGLNRLLGKVVTWVYCKSPENY